MLSEGGKSYVTVYICHPYSKGDVQSNIASVRGTCKDIIEDNCMHHPICYVPVAPHLLYPEFMSENTLNRATAMAFCKVLLLGCGELWVYYDHEQGITAGMRDEISFAGKHGIPILFKSLSNQ